MLPILGPLLYLLHRWPPCVAVAIPTTADPTARLIDVSRSRKDAGPGVHFVSPGLVQLTVLRHRRRSHEPAAVCPECGCTSGVGCSTVRPHHASATGAALASSSTSGGFQDGHPGLPVTVRQQLWRQVFCSCRSEAVEQPSNWTAATSWH